MCRIHMRYLSTAYVRNHKARISHRRGSLHVMSSESPYRIPLEAIDALLLIGGAQITTQALDACVRRGVRVAAVRSNGAVRFIVSGSTSGNVHLRLAQNRAASDHDQALAISKAIVAAKLQNSRHVMKRWARDHRDPNDADWLAKRASQMKKRLARLVEAETGDQVRGVEGDAARIYFGALGKAVASGQFEPPATARRSPVPRASDPMPRSGASSRTCPVQRVASHPAKRTGNVTRTRERKSASGPAATGHPTQNPNTETIGFRQ